MTNAERLAVEIGELLVQHGTGGGFVECGVTPEGPLFAVLAVIDAAEQRGFYVTVEENIAGPLRGGVSPS